MARDDDKGRPKRLFRLPHEGARADDEVDEEVRFHLERKTEALRREGLSEAEARAEALRRFGDVQRVKEGMRRMTKRRRVMMRWREWADAFRGDVRFGFRQLVASPVFTTVAVLTLALGIGADTAIFSVVDSVLFRPLPYPEPDELVVVWTDVTRRGGPPDEWLSWANLEDLREGSGRLEALAAWGGWTPVLTGSGEARQLLGARVSPGMFTRVLEVEPASGRGFRPQDHEEGGPPVVLLADRFWRAVLGADPSVVGGAIRLDDQSFTVLGIMPPDFRPPFISDADLWAPVRVDAASAAGTRGDFSWRTVGRLSRGASVEGLGAELETLGADLERTYPGSNTGMGFRAVPLRDDMVSEARAGLLVLLGSVALVLLIASINVAGLLMARAGSRAGELAVRSALGAGRGRIVQQLLVESGLLALVGGSAGVLLAFVGTPLLVSLAPEGTPRLEEVAVDGRILAFTALVTLLATVVFGLLPAVRAARSDLHASLREGGRGQGGGSGRNRLRSGLVVGQVALALVLLVGAGLLLRSFRNLGAVDLGFRPAGVLTMQVNLPPSRYGQADLRLDVYDHLESSLDAIPGVEAVGLTSTVPLTGFDGDVSFNVEGRPLPDPGEEDATWFRRVSPGYFEAMGISIVEGRGFTRRDDRTSAPVLVVNETLAARFFPDESAVGRRLNLGSPDEPTWREIVGVARDVRNFGIREGSRYATYSPLAQTTTGFVWPVVRTSLPPRALVPAVRGAVAGIDPSLAVARVRTMDEVVQAALAPERFVAALLSLFAALALILAGVGLYGVISYGVSTHLRELGVRMALGAGGSSILRMVLGRCLALVVAGLAVGLVAAWLLTGVLEGLLFGVRPTDPLTYAGVAAILAACAGVAGLVPALRATRVDAMEVLRTE